MFLICVALLLSIGSLIAASQYLKLNPFFSLLIAALIFGNSGWQICFRNSNYHASGLRLSLQQIGFRGHWFVLVGIVMERTGAMTSIGTKIIHAFGKSKTLIAMSMIGVVVGIPVFCDSGFIVPVSVNPCARLHRNKSSTTIPCFIQRIIYFSTYWYPTGPISCGRKSGGNRKSGAGNFNRIDWRYTGCVGCVLVIKKNGCQNSYYTNNAYSAREK